MGPWFDGDTIVALLALCGTVLAGLAATRQSRDSSLYAPYADLAARLHSLEEVTEALRSRLDVWEQWWRGLRDDWDRYRSQDAPPPPPPPPAK